MTHWIRSSLRIYSLALSILCFAVSNESWAAKRAHDLGPGEAFVIIKVSGDVKALGFQRFQGAENFVVKRHNKGQLIRVKAGRYYLRDVTTIYPGIRLPPNLEPSEPSRTIAIREGCINFIGDWNFIDDLKATDVRYDFDLRFNLDTVSRVVRKNGIAKYSLMVSKFGEQPIKTAMPAR